MVCRVMAAKRSILAVVPRFAVRVAVPGAPVSEEGGSLNSGSSVS